jgi:site-specific DNA recombinase
MSVAIYCRVSTEGQTLEQQVEACKNYCKIKDWNDIEIFREKESSGKVRPVWEDLLRRARNGRYSIIIVFRLDRAWRSSRQFIMDTDNLSSKGIYVISIMEGLDPTTPVGKCMMTVLVALAELEKTNISIATKQRLDALRKIKHIGRPHGSKDRKKRSPDGYLDRWAKVRGVKKVDTYTPERLNIKSSTK